MSITIIDFTDSHLTPTSIPSYPTSIIICSESCQISCHANILQSLTLSFPPSPGLYIFQVPNDFHRGIAIGLLCSTFPCILLSKTLPAPPILRLKQISPSVQLESVKEIYSKCVKKVSKTLLLNKKHRASKIGAIKAQACDLVKGVVQQEVSKGKVVDWVDIQRVVESIFQGLERGGLVKCGEKVLFNDILIQSFVGRSKSRVFVFNFSSPLGEVSLLI